MEQRGTTPDEVPPPPPRERFTAPGEGPKEFHENWQNTRVFVTNLSWDTTWEDLKDKMKEVGNVVYASVSCENGRSKGCGLVQFETVAEADAAISQLNGATFMGREIEVREDVKNAKGPKRSRPSENYQGDREEYSGDRERERKLQEGAVLPKRRFENQAGGGQEERHRLFISNLSFNTDWMVLKDHFKQIAPVAYVRVLQDDNRNSRGMGVVEFGSAADAAQAIATLHETELDGRTIYVREDIIGTNQARGETARGEGDAPRRDWDSAPARRTSRSAPPPRGGGGGGDSTRGAGARERRTERREGGGGGGDVRGEREKVWEQKDFGIPREFRDNDKNDNERSAAEDANGIPRYTAPANRGARGRDTQRRQQEDTDVYSDRPPAGSADKPKPPRDNYWA